MKRLVISVILATMTFSLAACGESSSDVKDISVANEESEGKTDNLTVSEEEAESEEEKEVSAEDVLKEATKDLDLATANAVEAGLSYLMFSSFSKQGLIAQLSSEYGDGYTEEQATTAVQLLEDLGWADWNEQAVNSAKAYLDMSGFSRDGLIDQLTSEYGEQFTEEQASSAVQSIEDAGEVDWNEEAVESAQSYLDMTSFSRKDLIDQLTSEYGEKFTEEEATYAVDQVGLN